MSAKTAKPRGMWTLSWHQRKEIAMDDIIEVFISLARMQLQAVDRAQEEVKPQNAQDNGTD